jgi:hypothetical protein
MTANTTPKIKQHSFKQGLIEEAKKAFALTLYLGTWFCSIAFLATTQLSERPIPLSIFAFAIIKAGICAKFMLIAQAAFPIKIDKQHGIVKSLFIESIIYIIVVISLSYVEAGVEGLMHHKDFITSMAAFGDADPLRVLAMAIIYWLIFWPYLIYSGVTLELGDKETLQILFGPKK